MKIQYSYTKYDSEEATRWSEFSGRLTASGFPLALLIGYLFSKLGGSFGLGIVIGLVIVIICGVYCKRKAAECAAMDMFEKRFGRALTEEEKKLVRKNIRRKTR